MNNNNLDQITMRSSKRKRERFNLKHKNETSFGIGEIQPLMCKEVVPNSNSVLSIGNVVRLAPMVAPTFGQLKLHHNVMFVGMSDLTDKFAALLANEPVAFGGGVTRVPQELPYITKGVLSSFILQGAKCTFYPCTSASYTDNNSSANFREWHYVVNTSWSETDPIYDIIDFALPKPSSFDTTICNVFGISSVSDANTSNNKFWCADLSSKSEHWQTAFKDYTGAGINLGRVLGWSHDFWVPSANFSPWSFLTERTYGGNSEAATLRNSRRYNAVEMNLTDVSPNSADYTILANVGGSTVLFCFQLSDFGKRLRKILISCGYGIDFKSTTKVSLMKLFALYKAWFDSFGITLYQGWETTNCAKVLQMFDSDYVNNFAFLMTSADTTPPDALTVQRRQDFVAFFSDLADMWFTEEQDFVTAHMRSAAVSPRDGVSDLFADAPNVVFNGDHLNIEEGSISPLESNIVNDDWQFPNVGGHAYIKNILHSQLDSEVLKRLYKVTNRNTIAGRRIAQLLKAQGLGEYMKKCKSNFIGHWSCDVDIFDVTAQADTYDITNSGGKSAGSALGEYVGKGVGEGKSKKFKYSTAEFGFIIDLAAVVPESGWMNSEDLSVRDIKKLDFYNPEYDGLGFEASPKSIVCNDNLTGSLLSNGATLDASFGFIPRYTKHKVTQNVANGDFTLKSTRAGYLPFSMDKFVDVGDRAFRRHSEGSVTAPEDIRTLYKLLDPSRVPIASPMYRYLARFPWMGQLNRIFANIGRDQLVNNYDFYEDFQTTFGESVNAWYLLNTPDNFIVHNVFLYDYYAPMLAIEDSFETHEDGNNGPSDMAIGKA